MTAPVVNLENMRCIRIPYKTGGDSGIPFGGKQKSECCKQVTFHEWGEVAGYGTDIPGSVLIEGLLWFDGEWISCNGVRIPGHLIPYAVEALRAMAESETECICLKYYAFRQMHKIRFSVSKNADRPVHIDVQRQCFESTDARDDGFRYVSAIYIPTGIVPAVASGIESVTKMNEIDVLSWYDLNKPGVVDG